MTTNLRRLAVLVLGGCVPCLASAPDSEPKSSFAPVPVGWSMKSPRDEIRPAFSYLPSGGPAQRGSFVIAADQRDGLFGWWEKTFPVQGGTTYEFSAHRKLEKVATPRRTT